MLKRGGAGGALQLTGSLKPWARLYPPSSNRPWCRWCVSHKSVIFFAPKNACVQSGLSFSFYILPQTSLHLWNYSYLSFLSLSEFKILKRSWSLSISFCICFSFLMIRIITLSLEIKVIFIGWLNLLLKIVDACFNVLLLWLGIQ